MENSYSLAKKAVIKLEKNTGFSNFVETQKKKNKSDAQDFIDSRSETDQEAILSLAKKVGKSPVDVIISMRTN